MKYIDEEGNELEGVDLTAGYLEDAEWIDHAEVSQAVHYEYEDLAGGGQRQRAVIDVPYAPAWREVTAQRYIRYTHEQLSEMARRNYALRLDGHDMDIRALSEQQAAYEAAYQEGVQGA